MVRVTAMRTLGKLCLSRDHDSVVTYKLCWMLCYTLSSASTGDEDEQCISIFEHFTTQRQCMQKWQVAGVPTVTNCGHFWGHPIAAEVALAGTHFNYITSTVVIIT